MLVQVCPSLTDPHTRKREITALIEAMKESGLQTGTIVTLENRLKIGMRGRDSIDNQNDRITDSD